MKATTSLMLKSGIHNYLGKKRENLVMAWYFYQPSLLTFMQWYVALAAQTKLLLGQPSKSESSPQMRPSPA